MPWWAQCLGIILSRPAFSRCHRVASCRMSLSLGAARDPGWISVFRGIPFVKELLGDTAVRSEEEDPLLGVVALPEGKSGSPRMAQLGEKL